MVRGGENATCVQVCMVIVLRLDIPHVYLGILSVSMETFHDFPFFELIKIGVWKNI